MIAWDLPVLFMVGCYLKIILYKTYIRTISNVGIPELLRFVTTDICICPGIMNSINDGLLLHAVPCKLDLNSHDNSMQSHIFKRSKDFLLLHNNTAMCVECNSFDSKIRKDTALKTKIMNTPAHQKAPLTKTHPNRVKLALQKERLKCSQLQKKVGQQMQQEITSQGVKLDDQLSSDINKIMTESIDISPFMKLFWEQQKESFTKASTGIMGS